MGTWRATAKSLTGESRWSSAPRAASGCTSPAPRSSAPPSQTSGTAPSARRKVQKEEQKLEREQKRGRIHLMESSGRRLQVSRRSHNKEDKLPIIDSGSVLRRVGCLPQYKAPVSRALSIHLSSHIILQPFHISVSPHLRPCSPLKPYFWLHQESFSIQCLSDYQCFKTDFR